MRVLCGKAKAARPAAPRSRRRALPGRRPGLGQGYRAPCKPPCRRWGSEVPPLLQGEGYRAVSVPAGKNLTRRMHQHVQLLKRYTQAF